MVNATKWHVSDSISTGGDDVLIYMNLAKSLRYNLDGQGDNYNGERSGRMTYES